MTARIACPKRLVLSGFLICASLAIPASADTLLVTSNGDSGAGTLRDTIAAAQAGDVITFDAPLDGKTIRLTSGQITIGTSLIIDAEMLGNGITISGDANANGIGDPGDSRVFEIAASVTLSHLTISGGYAEGVGTDGSGGGILTRGTLSLTKCTITGNSSDQRGGGVFVAERDTGSSAVFATESTFAFNSALNGGAIADDPSGSGSPAIYLTNCTVANNQASNNGGGVSTEGTPRLKLFATTVSGNMAGASGGGIYNRGSSVEFENALVAGNRAVYAGDVDGNVTVNRNGNLIGDGTGMTGIADGSGNLVGSSAQPINPRLAPLADYGGAVLTMATLVGSPAIDGGGDVLNSAGTPANDQRGFPRVGQPDIGAVEAGPVLLVTSREDSGAGTIRAAIDSASAPGTRILFNRPPESLGLLATSGQLTISGSKSIFLDASQLVDGSGNPIQIPDPACPGEFRDVGGVTITAAGSQRVFEVRPGGVLAGHSLTVSDGIIFGGNGAGFLNRGTLTLVQSVITRNFIDGRGGGISSLYGRGLHLIESSVIGNGANELGGGIELLGRARIVNSTIAQNNSGVGAGIFAFQGTELELSYSTITGNISRSTGGGFVQQGDSSYLFENCVIAGNEAETTGDDLQLGGGSLIRRGVNFIGSNEFGSPAFPEGFPNSNGDLVGTLAAPLDPLLGPLGENGGRTMTLKPLEGSPLIDGGIPVGFVPFADQRGFPRSLAGAPDLGAYETASSQGPVNIVVLYGEIPPGVVGEEPPRFEISTDPTFPLGVTTVAGTGTLGALNGNALTAELGYPSDVTEDSAGNRFIADSASNQIRMISPDGVVSTIAGTGAFGFTNGTGETAKFAFPSGIAIGPQGNLYVSDTINHAIRKLTRPTLPGGAWTVDTLAGIGVAGFGDGFGVFAQFSNPHGIAVDSTGNVYVADTLNHRIRLITPAGLVSTFAGTGSMGAGDGSRMSATLSAPFGVAIHEPAETGGFRVFIADSGNHRIRMIDVLGEVTTIAGSEAGFADGVGASGLLDNPSGVAVDSLGRLLVADKGNHAVRILQSNGPSSPWQVGTFAGTGAAGFAEGAATGVGRALFNTPTGIHVGMADEVLVADEFNHRLRRISDALQVEVSTTVERDSGVVVEASFNPEELGLQPEITYYFRWVTDGGIKGPVGETFVWTPAICITPFQVWQQEQFGSHADDLLIAGPEATPTNDGVANVIKYAHLLDPNVPVSGGLPTGGRLGNLLTLTYTRVLAAKDVTYLIEGSTNLVDWSDAGAALQILSSDEETQQIRASVSIEPGVPRKFLRIRYILDPDCEFHSELSPFQIWQQDQFKEDADEPSIAGPEANPTGDGVENIIKYAHFLDPGVPGVAGLPVGGRDGETIVLTYNKVISATDLTYQVECSTNLVDWTIDGITQQVLGDDGTLQEVRASIQIQPGVPMKFLRIRYFLELP